MSVINQVLNELERRGAHDAVEQPMVRAVQNTRRNLAVPLLVIGLVLIAVIAAWQWLPPREPAVIPVSLAPKTASSPLPSEVEKLKLQNQSAATAVVPTSGVSTGDVLGERLVQAPQAGLELSLASSAPLPASPQQDKEQTLKSDNSNPAANSEPVVERKTVTPEPHARKHPASASSAKTKNSVRSSAGAVPIKQISAAQRADAEFRRASGLVQLGRPTDAMAGYEAALRLDAGHEDARQALVALLLDAKRNEDAEQVLLEGLNIKPEHSGFSMLLARLQVERGSLEQATATLEKFLPFAETKADYRAFLAALLQRQNRNDEAISHYQIVLQHVPNNGVWLMGYGISLQAVHRNAEAKEAFKRSLDTQMLSPELQAFVQQKLKGL